MKDYIKQRVNESANHILLTHATIRQTAKFLKVSKSTIANDMTVRLPKINNDVALKVTDIIADNKADRHNRGGKSTKQKYRYIKGESRC